ncbi:MAG: hypothetical protein ACTHQ3_12490 [Motilibacteraceae bacterium]
MVLTAFLVPTQAASAADGCGDGWYKESYGYYTKDMSWQGAGNHNAWVYNSGRVTYCTDNDTFNDDENRKVRIGYPDKLESWVATKNGNYTRFCVQQTIKVHMTGIKSSTSWGISGEISKDDPSLGIDYSQTYDSLTLTFPGAHTCGADADQLVVRTSGTTVTADNETGEIQWVQLTTRLSMEYWSNGIKYGERKSLVENDYS